MLQQKIGRTKCPTKVAISSDIGKFWSAIARWPTVICSPERLYNSDNLPSTRHGIDRSLSAFENKTSSLLTKSVYETVFVSFSYKYTCEKSKTNKPKSFMSTQFVSSCGEGKHFLTTDAFVPKNPGNGLLKKRTKENWTKKFVWFWS